MKNSLRARLLMGTVAGTAIVLLCAGALVYWAIQGWLWQEFDRALAARASTLASLVEQEDDELECDIDYRILPEFDRGERPEYFQIRRTDGSTVIRSRSLGSSDLALPVVPTVSPVVEDMVLPDGQVGRVVAIRALPRIEHEHGHGIAQVRPIFVILAKQTADIKSTLAHIRWLMIGVALLAVGFSAILLFAVVGQGLRPLDRLAAIIAGLRPDDLSSRIHLGPLPGELVPVVDQMNSLLERIEAALVREKAFTADVAHELRTPLAGMRSTLEVSLSRQREPAAYRADLSESLKIAMQMQAMVNNLLCLARLEGGAVPVQNEPVGLDTLLAECWRPFEESAQQKTVEIAWPPASGVSVITDREKLRQILTNLLDNAVTYVDAGGRIAVEIEANATGAKVVIANTGSKLSAEDAARVFKRFWRGDAARQQTGAHCGLGLALSRMLAERIGGSLHADSTSGGVFRMVLMLRSSPTEMASPG